MLVYHLDGVADAEHAIDSRDPYCEQRAAAIAERRNRTGIDGDVAPRWQPECDPQLASRQPLFTRRYPGANLFAF